MMSEMQTLLRQSCPHTMPRGIVNKGWTDSFSCYTAWMEADRTNNDPEVTTDSSLNPLCA